MSGMGKAARELRVYVDVDAQVDLVLSPTATEEVTVVGQAEAVDLKKTEVNFNYTADAHAEPAARPLLQRPLPARSPASPRTTARSVPPRAAAARTTRT